MKLIDTMTNQGPSEAQRRLPTPAGHGHAPGQAAKERLLNVLIVEDREDDALLLQLELEKSGYAPQCRRVETQAAMSEALAEQSWDLVIADYRIPGFGGLQALELVRAKGLELPFIIVSGVIQDHEAVAAMKAGAHDYIMKGNWTRLGPAVQRELREAQARRERRRTVENLQGERKRAENRLAAEHAITRQLAGATSLEEAAPGILQALLDSLEVDLAVLWMATSDRARLQISAVRLREQGLALEPLLAASRRSELALGVGLAGHVWQERRCLWAADVLPELEEPRRDLAFQAGLQSAAAFPVQNEGDFFGVLELFATRRMESDPALVNMLTAIGYELGQFLQRRRAEEALRRAHDELEARVKRRTGELEAANARLRASMAERKRLEHELLDITERERRRIGLDLHDDLGQKLAGVALMTKGLELKLTQSQSCEAAAAATIHSLVQEAMSHASSLARDLATLEPPEQELPAALEELAARARDMFHIGCRFSSKGSLPTLEPPVVGQLCKIAQEALTNAIKHGKARRVAISLTNAAHKLVLTVQNDGLPFPALRSESTGVGLRIMNYRAHLIGASLDVKGLGTRGTLVTCTLPS
jgi:signal transduction histidine kinase/DNA-binding response OmpR family regulator